MSFTAQTPQPKLAWSFDSTLGPYIGSVSSTTQRGTLNYVPGKYISALNIQNPTGTTSNSINWYLITPISIDTGFSQCFWFRCNDLSYLTSIQTVSVVYNNYTNAFRFGISDGGTMLQITFYDGGNISRNLGNISTGIWYHLAAVAFNKTITVYINGSYTTDLPYTTSGITFNSTSLGLLTDFNGYPLTNGSFDDLRIFDRALTSTQVQSVYNQQGMPGRGVVNGLTPNITQTPVATIYGNKITPADTSPNKPTTSVSGQTTYSNAVPQYTQFGSGLALTPATTGLTISIVLTFNNGVFTTENLFYFGGNGNYQISVRLATFDALALQIWDSVASRFITYNPPFTPIASWSAGVKYYFTFTITPVSTTTVNYSVYVNGALNGSGSGTSTATALNNGTYTSATIGANNNGAYANMTVYDFVVLNTVLSDSQVSTLYQKQLENSNYQIAPPAALSGTPLFTQLSPAATSSAVGAFSLRAVNGITALSVKVRNGTTSATQDFYADRLGNLLTAPVVGQTLANWLGGATGYVTTWYDQSGQGNHATQATAANQPIIQRATKGAGYMVLVNGVNGTTSFGLNFGAYNLLNNTSYSTCGVVRRTASGATNNENYYLSGSGGVGAQDQYFHNGYRLTNQFTLAQYSDDMNVTVPSFTAAATEPINYNFSTLGTDKVGRIYSYSGGTLYPTPTSTRTFVGFLNHPVGASLSIGGGFRQFTGEIYELLVFTKSLYDLDNTGGLITQIYQNQLGAYGV